MKFLIVDDDHACRELLRSILSPYGHCDLAYDGQEAIDAVRLALEDGRPYDLITLDIMMPGIDGHAALDAIRRLERQHGVQGSGGCKVVMTTSLMDSKHCVRAFREGCESYCTKPLTETKVLEHVRGLLGPISPCVGDIAAAKQPATATPPATPRAGAAARRFLVVDDDGVCRELLKAMLSPHGQCSFATDGQEAIDAVRLALEDGRPYDLITLDIMMPGTNGHQALAGIRRVEEQFGRRGSDGAKVIMTTALRDSKHCIQSFREGCESYVTKPVDEAELLRRMRELGVIDEVATR